MAQPSFFDNVREFIAGIAWHVYLWGARMTEKEFLIEHERQAVEQIRAADGACAPMTGEEFLKKMDDVIVANEKSPRR